MNYVDLKMHDATLKMFLLYLTYLQSFKKEDTT